MLEKKTVFHYGLACLALVAIVASVAKWEKPPYGLSSTHRKTSSVIRPSRMHSLFTLAQHWTLLLENTMAATMTATITATITASMPTDRYILGNNSGRALVAVLTNEQKLHLASPEKVAYAKKKQYMKFCDEAGRERERGRVNCAEHTDEWRTPEAATFE